MPTKQQFTGYHGTPKSYVDSILKNGYTLSDNYQWFGRGIYFFGDNLPYFSGEQDAINWVLYVKEENEWAVFCATIVADKYFDMCGNTSDRVYYERLRDELLDRHRKANRRDETFSDRIVLEYLQKNTNFQAVRAFVEASKKHYIGYVISHPQMQICVRDPKAIISNVLAKTGTGNV